MSCLVVWDGFLLHFHCVILQMLLQHVNDEHLPILERNVARLTEPVVVAGHAPNLMHADVCVQIHPSVGFVEAILAFELRLVVCPLVLSSVMLQAERFCAGPALQLFLRLVHFVNI